MGLLGLFLGLIGLIGGVVFAFLMPLNVLVEAIFLIVALIGLMTSIMAIKVGRKGSGITGVVFSSIAVIVCIIFTFACSLGRMATDFISEQFGGVNTEFESALNDLADQINAETQAVNDAAPTPAPAPVPAPAPAPQPAELTEETSAILGSWEYVYGGYIYTFNADHTGTYEMRTTVMDFTYEVNNGILSILYSGSTVPMDLEYSIDGDVLKVKDSSGNDTLYNKK